MGFAPPTFRDCLDCHAKEGMQLQNIAHTAPINIPLLYVCQHCGATLTIPPPLLTLPSRDPHQSE